MGSTKLKKGDGHIIFHVGKELPAEGSNLLLVPGIQKAQGRGIYCADEPRLKYSGGEAFQKKLEITPIYCLPMIGEWIKAKNKKKQGEISFQSNERLIALYGLQSFEGVLENQPVRYYYPREVRFFKEPDTERQGRHILSRFSSSVLSGERDFDDAIDYLEQESGDEIEDGGKEYILEKMFEAMRDGRIPEQQALIERLQELRLLREGSLQSETCMANRR
jgi:hypothetical protein